MEKQNKKLNSLTFTRKNNDSLKILDNKPLVFDYLGIIVTKKCNLACAHCMRGEAQNKEIKKETFDAIFEKTANIKMLDFHGGELSLSPNIIADCLASLIEHDIIVHNFGFSTNGLILTDEFIHQIYKMQSYIRGDMIISISVDDFHLNEMIKKGYTLENLLENVKRYRSEFGDDVVLFKGFCDVEVFNEGRSTDLPSTKNIKKHNINPLNKKFGYTNCNNFVYINGLVSMSTEGEILPDCNLSYDNEKVFSAGNIKTDKVSTIFSNLNAKEISTDEIKSFRKKVINDANIDNKNYKRYLKSDSYRKTLKFWNDSQPQRY